MNPEPTAWERGCRLVAALVAGACANRRRALATLLLCLGFATLAFGYGRKIPINSSLRALLPEDAPSIRALHRAAELQGVTDILTLAIESSDSAANLRFAEALAHQVSRWPETEFVEYERDFTPLRDRALYRLEIADLERLRARLVAQKQAAIVRATRPGLVDDDIPLDQVTVGDDDWDRLEPSSDPPDKADEAAPQRDPLSEGDTTRMPPLREWFETQREALRAAVGLRADELDALWPPEDPEGRLHWSPQVSLPMRSPDGRVYVVQARLTRPVTDVRFVADLADRIDRTIAKLDPSSYAPDLRAELVGAYDISGDVQAITHDLRRATLLSVGGVIIVLWAGFRRIRAVFIIMIPVVVAVTAALALAHATYGELNALTAFLFAVLFGMGVDFSVHLLAHRIADAQSWYEVVREQLRPLGSAMLTTAGCLFALALADFKAFREFGVISGVGVVFALIFALLLVPALETLLPIAPRAQPPKAKPGFGFRPKRPLAPTRKATLLALAGFALVTLPMVGFEHDTRKLRPPRPEHAVEKIPYGKALGENRNSVPTVLIAEDPADLTILADRLLRIRDAQRDGKSWVRDVLTLERMLPDRQHEKSAVLAEIRELSREFIELLDELAPDDPARIYRGHLELLAHMAATDPLRPEVLPAWARRPFESRDGRTDRIGHAYLDFAKHDIRQVRETVARFRGLSSDLQVDAAVNNFVFADLAEAIERDTLRLPLLALTMILLAIWFDLRRWRDVAMCFGALCLGIATVGGIIGLIGIKINFFNLVVIPAVVGLGIDTGIHLWHAGNGKAMAATRRASLIAAWTTAAAFGGLLVSRHPGLRSMAELGILAIVTCVGVAFLWLYRAPERVADRN